ncbi:CU044_5270 family protein [Actinomadura syzygii]|uniref:CU044_5270 family protein n=1 Tax=Actinomadura syzygii TaxID=1427538 RepID=A0A5D0TW72_9ACTN|nr:CU044_5270 family protein [Actinomadura syzygii]TYC09994.1 hypothetical protein FXF65_33375 [Actinomadura syzygii]
MNDDIQEVRTMLAPANPVPRGSMAGSAQDGTGRAARARIMASGSPTRARTWTARVVVAGGLAVAIAGGTTVAQNLGGADENGRRNPGVPAFLAGPVANAEQALGRAAFEARRRPFTAPRPDQWAYVQTEYRRVGNPEKQGVFTSESRPKKVVDSLWTRADGKMMASLEGGKLELSPTGGAMPPQDYATLSKLPRDPDALLAWARKASRGGETGQFSILGSVLADSVLPPAQEAAIYQALAKTPGVTLDKQAVDLRGRPALSLSLPAEGWLRQEVLLDPSTFAYRGHRTLVTEDHTDQGMTYKKGTVESQSVRLASGIVDRPGQRPTVDKPAA